jgi:hypothetical protein
MTDLFFHNLHAPDEVRVFEIPACGVRCWDETALVYDVRVGQGILRHYSFARRWFEVNCSLDLDGNFLAEAGPIEWCFNCDICTPHLAVGNNLYNMDLWIDVLVGVDGHQHVVSDEDEFADAAEQGWMTAAEQDGARRGLEELLTIIRSTGLIPFVEQICPFQNIAQCGVHPPTVKRRLADVPLLGKEIRQHHWT